MALLSGRKGHARVVLMPIIDAELEAVQQMFGATKEIGVSAVYTRPEFEFAVKDVSTPEKQYPFVVAQSAERSNAPAALSVREVLENYRPEVVVVVGIGGGIQRLEGDDASAVSGPKLGDVVIGRYVHYAEYTKNLPGGSYLRYISLDQPSSRLVSQHAQPLASAPSDVCFSRLVVRRPIEGRPSPRRFI